MPVIVCPPCSSREEASLSDMHLDFLLSLSLPPSLSIFLFRCLPLSLSLLPFSSLSHSLSSLSLLFLIITDEMGTEEEKISPAPQPEKKMRNWTEKTLSQAELLSF